MPVLLDANWPLRFSSLFYGALGAFLLLGLVGLLGESRAQQKIGYVDNQYVLKNLPEYATVQQKLDKLEQQWKAEIQKRKQNVQKLKEEYSAWKLLYTEEERKKKKAAIEQAQKKVEQLRKKYFGPKGRLYTRQKKLMRPIQERILKATRKVAKARGYDYVFDKGGKVLFMYARKEHNLSDPVLRELGINPQKEASRR
ncbi:MAG: OmpH family outer membrane protein [Salinibacter sp.]|uniref:OmpH family outer membrane protein n=1 Tax=Salinibacter sp. TaxID=2065818 RepID=UPI0035D409CF